MDEEKKKEAKKIGEGPVVQIKEQLTLGQEVQIIGILYIGNIIYRLYISK